MNCRLGLLEHGHRPLGCDQRLIVRVGDALGAISLRELDQLLRRHLYRRTACIRIAHRL
jgi:hypothetical protein